MKTPTSFREEVGELSSQTLAESCAHLFHGGAGTEFRPAADLLRPDVLGEVLARFGRRYAEGDPRAVASLWSQWYFGTLIVPAVSASLVLGRRLPLEIEAVEVRLGEERAQPGAFRLPHGGGVDPESSPGEDLRPLVERHVEPLAEAIADHTGVGRGALLGNAARYLAWTLDELEQVGGEAPVAEVRHRLLERATLPGGRANPLEGMVDYVREGGIRTMRRKVCCLRYLLPGVDGCGALCPLPQVREAATD